MSLDKEYLRVICQLIEAKLPDNHGFILLTFPFGDDPGGRVTYASNSQRKDCIAAMKEFLIRNAAEEDWMKHIT